MIDNWYQKCVEIKAATLSNLSYCMC